MMSCSQSCAFIIYDDDTVGTWHATHMEECVYLSRSMWYVVKVGTRGHVETDHLARKDTEMYVCLIRPSLCSSKH